MFLVLFRRPSPFRKHHRGHTTQQKKRTLSEIILKLSKDNKIKVLFLADGITARKQGGFKNSKEYEVTESQKKTNAERN